MIILTTRRDARDMLLRGSGMAKEICQDCGKIFDGGPYAYFCPDCRRKRLSGAAKRRQLNKLGNAAYSAQQARRRRGIIDG